MIKMVKLSTLFLLSLSLSCFADEIPRYKYVGWYDRDFKSIVEPSANEENGWLVIGNDAFYEASFCKSDDDYVCIFSKAYAFSFPTGNTEVPLSWELNGITYRVVRQGISLSLWGRQLTDIYLIEAQRQGSRSERQSDSSIFSLYTRDLGVLGFSFAPSPEGETPTVFWLTGPKGFGAMPQ